MLVYHATPAELWESTIRQEGLKPQPLSDGWVNGGGLEPFLQKLGMTRPYKGICVWPEESLSDNLFRDFAGNLWIKRSAYSIVILECSVEPRVVLGCIEVNERGDKLALRHTLDANEVGSGGLSARRIHDVRMDLVLEPITPEQITPKWMTALHVHSIK